MSLPIFKQKSFWLPAISKKWIQVFLTLLLTGEYQSINAQETDSLIARFTSYSSSDTSRIATLKKIIDDYLNQDTVNDSVLIWVDTLSLIQTNRPLDNKLSAQIFSGKYYIRKAEFGNALKCFYEVLQVAQKEKLQNFIADSYLQIGVVFFTQKQFQDALESFHNSLSVYENLKDDYRISILNYLIGNTLCDLNRSSEAILYLDKAIEAKIRIKDRKGEHEAKIAKARLLLANNDFIEAEKLYNECLAFFMESRNWDAVSFIQLGLSGLYQKQNSYALAESILLKALVTVDSFKLVDRKISVLQELKDLYIANESYEKAVAFQTQYYQLKDSIYNFDNTKTIEVLKAKIEADKKQAEIEALQHKEKVAGIQRIFGVAVIFFLLVFLYNLYKRFSFKKRAEEKLARTNKDLENTITNLKAAEEELIHAEKMASMGRLTSGIAHELRNPLNFVSNFSKLSEDLVTDISNGPSEDEKIEAIRQLKNNLALIQVHSGRADSIIRSMLQLSRKSSTERTPELLNKLVEEFVNVAYKNYTDSHHSFKCEIEFDLDKRINFVQMNSHEITGVVLSLVHNAFDSMVERKEEEPNYRPELSITTRLDNDKAFVHITDNGKGIPEDIHQKIFEPFFSTKPIDKGTGLGLSLCYDFIKVHQGGISATSNDHKTTLTFFLPVNASLVSKKIDHSNIIHYKN